MALFSSDFIIETIRLGPGRTQKRFVRTPKSSKRNRKYWDGPEEIDLYRPHRRYRSPSLSSEPDEERIAVYRHNNTRSPHGYGGYSPGSSNASISSDSSRRPSPQFARPVLGPAYYGQQLLPAAHSPSPINFHARPGSPHTGPIIHNNHGVIESPGLIDDMDEADWANAIPPPPPPPPQMAPIQRRSTVGHNGGRSYFGGHNQMMNDNYNPQYHDGGVGGSVFFGDDNDLPYDVQHRVPGSMRGGTPGGGRAGGIRYVR